MDSTLDVAPSTLECLHLGSAIALLYILGIVIYVQQNMQPTQGMYETLLVAPLHFISELLGILHRNHIYALN